MDNPTPENRPSHRPSPRFTPVEPSDLVFLTQPIAAFLLIGLLATAIYSNTFSAAFHFDDILNITDNSKIKHLANLRDLSGSRYVGFLTFALNYRFGGLHVFGYHLVNLLVHITNGFFVYLLVRLLFRAAHTPRASPLTTAPWIAVSVALLFVAHPIQTEAVTYITQRFASLAALLYLLTVILYLHWRLSPPEAKGRLLWYVGALLSTVLAMKTKENTFTLPLMLLLIEAVFFRLHSKKQWATLIPFLLTLFIIPLSSLDVKGETEVGLTHQTTEIGRFDYFLTQFRVIVTYLRLLVFPVHQNLDYDYPVYHSFFYHPVFFSFLFLSALFAMAIYLLLFSRLSPPASGRLIGFGILWFFLTLSIESSIIPLKDVIWEYRLYLPSVGFGLAICTTVFGFSDRLRAWKLVGTGVLVIILSLATYQRNRIWYDELSLWSDVVHKSPNKARGHNNLGRAYGLDKRSQEAITQFGIILKQDPANATTHFNLGNVYLDLERFEEAAREYQSAIESDPTYAEAHDNLGLVYDKLGRRPEAIREYKAAITANPGLADAYNNLGIAFKDLGRLTEAAQSYQKAITLNPDLADAHNNLGVVFKAMGHPKEAVREYERALVLEPGNATTQNNLGNVYADLGLLDEAIQNYQAAMILKPNDAEVYYNLGLVLYRKGQLKEALVNLQEAIRLKPNHAQAHNSLGLVYNNLGRRDEAIQEYQAAIRINPDYTLAYNNLGVIYYEQGKFPNAIIEFKQSLHFNSGDPQVHNILGLVYEKLGHPNEAVEEFQTAIKLGPNFPEAYFNLGTTYQRSGRIPEAIQAFEQALKIKPDYDKARQALNALRR